MTLRNVFIDQIRENTELHGIVYIGNSVPEQDVIYHLAKPIW